MDVAQLSLSGRLSPSLLLYPELPLSPSLDRLSRYPVLDNLSRERDLVDCRVDFLIIDLWRAEARDLRPSSARDWRDARKSRMIKYSFLPRYRYNIYKLEHTIISVQGVALIAVATNIPMIKPH